MPNAPSNNQPQILIAQFAECDSSMPSVPLLKDFQMIFPEDILATKFSSECPNHSKLNLAQFGWQLI